MSIATQFANIISIGGINCTELIDGSGRGQAKQGDGSASRSFLLDWTNLPAFLNLLLGSKTLSGTSLTVVPPAQHPTFLTWFCQDTDFEPVGAPTGVNAWEYAKVTAKYTPIPVGSPNSGDPSDGVEEEIDFDLDVITVPGGSLKDSSNNPIGAPQKKILPCASYVLKTTGQPLPPGGTSTNLFGVMFGLLGKVNSATFRGAAAKKMLFIGGRCRRKAVTFSSLDSQAWESELRLKFRPIEWTKVYSPALGAFAEATAVVGGAALYDSDDLNPLLPH